MHLQHKGRARHRARAGAGEKVQPQAAGKGRGQDVSARPALPETRPATAKTWFWLALQKSGMKQHSLEIPLENVLGTEKKHITEKNLMYGRAESSHM